MQYYNQIKSNQIYNTYNHEAHTLPGRADTRILAHQNLQERTIITGDFNARHPLWGSKVPPNGINAATLYDIIENNSLDLVNEPTLTTPHRHIPRDPGHLRTNRHRHSNEDSHNT